MKLAPAKYLTIATLTLSITATLADDWPQWRGPNRDAICKEKNLLTEWPAEGPPIAWRVNEAGSGFSSVAVANGIVYTLGDFEEGHRAFKGATIPLNEGSHVIAFSEKNGDGLWVARIGDAGGHRKYPGTRGTPTVDGGQVFVLNQHGDVACLDAKGGRMKWVKNIVSEFGGKMMSGWKYSESPLVDDERVVVTPGGAKGTMLALNRDTGEKIWQTSEWTDPAGYSSIIIATIHGTRQYVQLTGKSIAGVDPASGKLLWKADRLGKTAVIPTPVVKDDIVFVTSGYGIGCNGFRVAKDGDQWSAEEIYANTEIANHHGGVVLVDGHVYGATGSTFRCVDIKDGESAFRERSVGKGSTLFIGGSRFILRSEGGPVALIEASPDGMKEISKFEQPDRSEHRAWPHPVVANGKLYLRDQDLLLCYDLGAK